jgi:hypothetical protein
MAPIRVKHKKKPLPSQVTVTTSVRMRLETRNALQRIAEERGQSTSELLRLFVLVLEELQRVAAEGGYLAVVDGKGVQSKLML